MCARSVRLEPFTGGGQGQGNDQQERDCIFTCKLLCCKCSFCHWVATKERCKSQLLLQSHRTKICERCFLCRSLEFCKSCHKCPNCCYKSTCRCKVTSILGEVRSSGFESKSSHNTETGLHPPFPVQTQSNQVTNCHKQLCQPTETVQSFGGIVSVGRANQNSLGFYNRLFLVPKPNNEWRPILDLSTLNTFLNTESFKMETPETIRTSLQLGEWVTSIDFKDTYFHMTIHSQSRKYMRFHIQGQSYQFKSLPFGLSTAPMEFTVVVKEVKLMALQRGIRIHQYLDDWLVRATSHQTCLQHTQTFVALCRELGWLVNKEKSELDPKQVFNFVGDQFDLREGKVRPTPERWQTLTDKILSILSSLVCPVRQFMSLILTATEKQVHPGRLHMRPMQWHLKHNWRVPESLEKVIPVPRSLHPDLRWWLEESNVLPGQSLHPLKHALQIFTDTSKEGWGTHKRKHCKGNLIPSRKQVAHKPLGTWRPFWP